MPSGDVKGKLDIWKVCIYHYDLDKFSILKDYSDDINNYINTTF